MSQNKVLEDSVRTLIKGMPAAERLTYLDQHMYENVSNFNRLIYARLLYEESLRQRNEQTEADALFMLAKHFYANSNDSMRYWIKKAEPLYRKLGRHEELCRMKGWDIYAMDSEGKGEEVLRAIDNLKTLSRELAFPEGLEMADMALANFYFSNTMFKEGEELYLNVLKRMEERDAPIIKRYTVVRHLFNRMPEVDSRLAYLKKAEDMLKTCKEQGMTYLDPESPIIDLEYTLHRNYCREYVNVYDLQEAWNHLHMAQQIADANNISRAQSELLHLYYMCHRYAGEYDKALEYIEKTEKRSRQRNIMPSLSNALKNKSFLLNELGRSHEAYHTLQEHIALQDSINNNDFHRVLAELRTKHEVEKLEIESQQAELKAEQNRLRLSFMYVCGLILVVVLFVLAYMVYVNNRKEKKIKAAKEKAEEIDNLKTTFLSHINNEIRNPLNAIVGFSDILIDEEDQDTRQQYAKIVEENNELLQQLIADVLDISKIESNSMTLFLSEQDLPTILGDIYDDMKPWVSNRVEFVLDPCSPLGLRVDKNRLTQIILNLLRNAIKFTEQGSIHFGYTVENEQVRFYVTDTGIGIPEDLQIVIFDRFAQMAQGKRKTGLGLAIAKGLVVLMGGDIHVESTLNRGTTFFFTIPRA
ncbi:HAMP domain-containing sensor histidine kinase [Parabacteroides sp. PF5-6]|uniref:tetratricopeptide repeat-containing sensor histidine kinase n=1 Tax=Parabacteroides sp. PF5-6 TaxID=1742403 RepID=UPI002404A7B0|nr:HAMP domain-containing sensor histidine kinase [Parabacteroides sp. PF5-6]